MGNGRIEKQVMAYHMGNRGAGRYKTSVYGWIDVRKNGELTITSYAVSDTKTHGISIVPVNRAWTDSASYQSMNLWRNVWVGLQIEFNEKRNRPQESYGWYEGKWGRSSSWAKLGEYWYYGGITYINLDAIKESAKYRYSAFAEYLRSGGTMTLVPYLKLYSAYHEVEILSKLGLVQFVTDAFCKRMADKGFAKYFRSVAKDITNRTRVQAIVRAYANGWSLAKAEEEEAIRYAYNGAPNGIDKRKLHRYLVRNGLDYWDWRHYMADAVRAGHDATEFGVAFPRDFRAAEDRIALQLRYKTEEEMRKAEAKRKQYSKKVAKMSARINELLDRMADRLAWRVGEYTVIIPQTQDEFVAEGNAMRNCIGGYYDRCSTGQTMCFFIRKGEERIADVEADPKTGALRQCLAVRNGAIGRSDEAYILAETMAKRFSQAFKRKVA